MDFNSLDIPQLIIFVLAIIGGIWVVVKIGGKIIKTVVVLAIIGLAVYLFVFGGSISDLKRGGTRLIFAGATLSGLEERYCSLGKEEKYKSECIARPVAQDLKSRLTAAEMRDIDKDKDKIYRELHTSMGNKRKEINDCLIKNKGAKGVQSLIDEVDKIEVKQKD
jgi:energy-coupling factor transporter transmembrane protein EcfT